jgi:hypothetical protein
MSFWMLFWILGGLICTWLFLADLVGAIRYAYAPLGWRSLGMLWLASAAVARLFQLSADASMILVLLGTFWMIRFQANTRFQQDLSARDIRLGKLLRFR